ncbi:hypothetical protein CVT25_000496 [Psilocybe cyanescens]|uniref:Uncharacterized protein n=1 Tax=Psilocybe cyanescens TaxID=93625 RepID=A0A409XWB1_PSICY|nr:hypothetical protein CVT25_000496 [Psilocybe cyanescens]
MDNLTGYWKCGGVERRTQWLSFRCDTTYRANNVSTTRFFPRLTLASLRRPNDHTQLTFHLNSQKSSHMFNVDDASTSEGMHVGLEKEYTSSSTSIAGL